MNPDDLKRAWQAQDPQTRWTLNADVLLQQVVRGKKDFVASLIRSEIFIVGVFSLGGLLMLALGLFALHLGLGWRHLWSLFVLAAMLLGLAALRAVDRARRLRARPSHLDPILSCLEDHLRLLRHEIRVFKHASWWAMLLLPLGLGVFFLHVRWMTAGLSPGFVAGIVLALAVYAWSAREICRWYVCKYYEPRERELEAMFQSLSGPELSDVQSAGPRPPLPSDSGRWPVLWTLLFIGSIAAMAWLVLSPVKPKQPGPLNGSVRPGPAATDITNVPGASQ